MIRDLLRPLAELLIAEFLVERGGHAMPTTRFLPFVGRRKNMQATFSEAFLAARNVAAPPPASAV